MAPTEICGLARSELAKIVDWDRLLLHRERARTEGLVVVWTNGCFDLLHVGHVRSLQAARTFGDLLVVGLNTDESVRRLKGAARPVYPLHERAEILSALACVDYVIAFSELTPEVSLAKLRPDVHCKGTDYAPPDGKPFPEKAVVEAYGGRVEFTPLVPSTSTTDLLRRLQHG